MPAKKNTGGEEAPPKPDRRATLQAGRRALEVELAEIDGKIRDAISSGDVEAMGDLVSRKAALPKAFIEASLAERAARQEAFNAEDAANLKALEEAEEKRDELRATILKRRRELEEEIAKLTAELQDAEAQVSAIVANIAATREVSAANDAGFKRSLAKLAGV